MSNEYEYIFIINFCRWILMSMVCIMWTILQRWLSSITHVHQPYLVSNHSSMKTLMITIPMMLTFLVLQIRARLRPPTLNKQLWQPIGGSPVCYLLIRTMKVQCNIVKQMSLLYPTDTTSMFYKISLLLWKFYLKNLIGTIKFVTSLLEACESISARQLLAFGEFVKMKK